MTKRASMLYEDDVKARARTAFDRNWRTWAQSAFADDESEPSLTVNVHPPRESDLQTGEQLSRAREWVAHWRTCKLSGVEWQQRSWASAGDQTIPMRVRLESASQIALWANRLELWETALSRIADVRERLIGTWSESMAPSCRDGSSQSALQAATLAVPSSIADWCALDERDWQTALDVWDWLFAHLGETRYVRQLPIRGIDTKWIEHHEKPLRRLYRELAGCDFSFAQPAKQFRCKACSPQTHMNGCDEFALSADQLAATTAPPQVVVICENLVNTLCLHDLPGTLAIHGAGFAVMELQIVSWLAETPIVYWGDLDSSGFAILNALRSFAPSAQSCMMDDQTLYRYFDLCVDEPRPATGTFERLTAAEHETLHQLVQGDSARNIANLRLEQERIEWGWAYERIRSAVLEALA